MRKHIPILLICGCSFFNANTQTPLSGIVNHYTAVLAIDSCNARLTVTDTTGFRKGGSVLLCQMQGAEISTANSAFFGFITALNAAGQHERAVIDSVGASDVFLSNRLTHTYSIAGKTQLVSIPIFENVLVIDTLRAKPWDGATGGVIALEVSGTLTLNAPILASGAGFRGGADYLPPNNGCNWAIPISGYVFGLGNWRGGRKGEGIALLGAGFELGRGPQASGGGGGNDHNAGGGGGGNATKGGDGGDNADPNPIGCNGYFPGIGGYQPQTPAGRIFLGGGGGAGHANNLLRSKGGNGGGIVLLKAGAIAGSTPAILANGTDAGNSFDDGAGGGGAGGSIWLDLATGNPNLLLQARGGKGGSADNGNVDRCMGPGGGGAGGRIFSNPASGIFEVTGGAPGITFNSTSGCNNKNNNAQAGAAGVLEPLSVIAEGAGALAPLVLQQPAPDTVCGSENAAFTLGANAGNWVYQWQFNNGSGWQDIAAGGNFSGFQSDSLTLISPGINQHGWQFRCQLRRPGCSVATTTAATLSVFNLPNAGFSATVNGLNVSFSNTSSNASSYYWNFGDPASGSNSSTQQNPVHVFSGEGVFSVTLYAINACDTAVFVQNISTLLTPTAAFAVPANITACDFASIVFENQSTGTGASYQWQFPGGTPGSSTAFSPTVVYQNSGTYTVTLVVSNAAGTASASRSFNLVVTEAPTASFNFSGQNTGSVQFSSQTSNASNLLWNFGDPGSGSNSSTLPNPLHVYTQEGSFTVTLSAWNTCDTVTVQQTFNVVLRPTAGFSVPANTLACGSAQVSFQNLSSANANTFSWSFPGGSPATSSLENPSVTYTSSGTYTARLIAANAAGADTLTQIFSVQIFELPSAAFDWQILSANGLVTFENLSQNADAYTWDFGDGSPPQSGFNVQHQYAASGTYVVTLAVNSPCGVAIFQDEITLQVVGTNEAQSIGSLLVFPNPAQGWLQVDWSETGVQVREIQVFDLSGKMLFSKNQLAGTRAEIPLGALPAGVYQLRVLFPEATVSRAVLKQ